tara:strand:- start:13351 stop:14196 length:846 start_codon:yes stop_codon:yes gene_type:complete
MKDSLKILVLGKNGMLGHQVFKIFERSNHDVYGTSRLKDSLNPNEVYFDVFDDDITSLEIEKYDYVINCIGIIKQRLCEEQYEKNCVIVNTVFPQKLQEHISKTTSKLIHISTDCVFGENNQTLDEREVPFPDDLYGKTKLWGEPKHAMTLRMSIIGNELNSARKLGLLEWAKSNKGKKIKGYKNHYWNGLTAPAAADAIIKIVNNKLWNEGVYHIHCDDFISKYELLQNLNTVMDLKLDIEPIFHSKKISRILSSTTDLQSQLSIPAYEIMVKSLLEGIK